MEKEIGKKYKNKNGCVVEVVEYLNAKQVLVRFLDEHSFEGYYENSKLQSGDFGNPFHRSCFGIGYLGMKYQEYRKEDRKKIHGIWSGMIRRCYSAESLSRFPLYKDCTVCENWHNFENFYFWYISQKGFDMNYEIDKDLLIEGNKVYSPDTCCLIPKRLNSLITKTGNTRKGYKTGVRKNKNTYRAVITLDGKKSNIGIFKTLEEAHLAYIENKENYVRSLANEYLGEVEVKVIEALLVWRYTM